MPRPTGKIVSLPIDLIRLDTRAQQRADYYLDMAIVEVYEEAIRAGAVFPPIVVFFDGQSYWLAAGFHRLQAHLEALKTTISAEVIEGTLRDAILYSVGENSAHGKMRTNADKQKAVERLLADSDWGKRSTEWIAESCAVSWAFTDRVRKLWDGRTGQAASTRTGRDGREHPAHAPEEASEEADTNDAAGQAEASAGLPPVDAVGQPIPAKLREVFADRRPKAMLKLVGDCERQARALIDSLGPLAAKFPPKLQGRFLGYFESALALLAGLVPHAVDPDNSAGWSSAREWAERNRA